MPAKSAPLEVLRDSSLSKDEMSTEALKCARLHNMSRARIEKIHMDLYGDLSPVMSAERGLSLPQVHSIRQGG